MSSTEFRFTRRDTEYLKILYDAHKTMIPLLGPLEISNVLSVSKVTAYQELQKLVKLGYVIHHKSKGYSISARGIKVVEQLIRNHRILETFFVKILNIPPDEACKGVSGLEFAIKSEFVDRLCAFLNHPSHCPHGKEIPQGDNCCKIGRNKK